MTKWMSLCAALLLSVTLLSATQAQETSQDQTETKRYFLFVGHIGPEAWTVLIKNPQDRKAASAQSIEKLGGELIAYYFGMGNNKNYVIVSLPDTEVVKAIQVLRMSSGLLTDYEVIELIDSADMLGVFARMDEVMAADDMDNEHLKGD